jgi:hypothetical protein
VFGDHSGAADRGNRLHQPPACFETRPGFAASFLSMRNFFDGIKKDLILRRPRSGRLEGRTA